MFVIPLALTFYIIASGITFVDGLLSSRIPILSLVPGSGLVIVLISITFIGVLANYLITEPISNWFLGLLDRVPLLKLIYSSIRDFMESFFGEKKKFNEPVIVQINDYGLKRVGFITQKDLSKFDLEGEVGVYFPNSYGIMGEYYIIPADKVKPLNMNSADVMKYVVSGGVSDI
ncbi:hypothetical protein D3C72_1366640 [compost metagenome]